MTSKTKYIVIVLLLLVLATTSVGLSTWNIHYQAIVGDIDFTMQDPSTKDSVLNRYIYFTPAKDTNGNIATDAEGNITTKKQSYPIGISGAEDIFTYIYDAKTHTPTVFVPSKEDIKGSDSYPTDLFLADGALNLDWGIENVFDEIEFKYEYRLIAMPFVADYKGKSDNYCEVHSVTYGADTNNDNISDSITVCISWKNGKGNHNGENVTVVLGVDGTFTVYDQNSVEIANPKISASINGSRATIGVDGFNYYNFSMESNGWTETAPSDAGVYQCRITAVVNDAVDTSSDTNAHKNAANEAIEALNALQEDGINYAAQVTYAILPAQVEQATPTASYSDTTQTFSTRRLNTANAPTSSQSETVDYQDDTNGSFSFNEGAIVGTSFVYKGQNYNISITSNVQISNDLTFSVDYAFDQEKNAQDITEHSSIESSHIYTTYGFSSNPNYVVSNPEAYYCIIKQEVKITGWTGLTTTYNGAVQEPIVTLQNHRGETIDAEHGEIKAVLSYSYNGNAVTETKNAGVYTVTVSLADAVDGSGYSSQNYKLVNAYAPDGQTPDKDNLEVDFTIQKAPLTVTAKAHKITYGDALSNNGVSYSGFIGGDNENNSIFGDLQITSDYDTTNATKRIVGSYTLTPSGYEDNDTAGNPIYANDGHHNYTYTYATGTLTVEKLVVAINWTNLSFTFDGTEHKPTATVNNKPYEDDTIDITIGFDGTTTEAINAGTYTAIASTLEGDDAGNYTLEGTATLTKDFTISPKDISSANITITSSLTYNGSEQTVAYTVTITLANDTIATLGDADFTATGDKATNAYDNPTLTLIGKGNYCSTITQAWKIAQLEIGIDWTNTSFTYDGQSHKPTATATGIVDGDTINITIELDGTATDAINAGTYTAKATGLTGDDAGNYKLPATATKTFTIAKAPNEITSLTVEDWTFGQTANEPNIEATYTTGVVYTYSADGNTFTSAVPTNAGAYTIKAEIPESTNYLSATATTAFTIAKAQNTITLLTIDGWTFGQTASIPVIVATYAENVVYTYSTAQDGEYTATVPTNAGTYTIKAEIPESDNYLAATATTATFTIKPKQVTMPQKDDTTFTYTGAAQTYGISSTAEYSVTGNTRTNAGSQEVVATLKDTTNYVWTDGTTAPLKFTFTIEKAQNTITSLTIANWTFGQTASTPALQATYTIGAVYTYSADGTTFTSEVPKNAGDYYIKVEIPESANYLAASATTTFTINKAPNAIVWSDDSLTADKTALVGWTFGSKPDSAPHTAKDSFENPLEITYYRDEACTSPIDFAEINDIGTYYAKAVSQDHDSNHHGTPSVMSFAVTEPSIDGATVELSTTTLVYNGTKQTVGVTVTLGETPLDSANYTVTYTLEGEETGSDHIKNAGTYTVTITGINQYQGEVVATEKIVVAKAQLTVTADDIEIAYGDAIPSYTVSYDGFGTGDDASKLAGTLTFDCDYTQTSIVGSYTITPSGYTVGNYTYVYVAGTLTVKNATITEYGVENISGIYKGSAFDLVTKATTVNNQPATFKYGTTEGTYNRTSLTITNVADSKTYYYQITAPYHDTVTGSFTVDIQRATPTFELTLSATNALEGDIVTATITIKDASGKATTGIGSAEYTKDYTVLYNNGNSYTSDTAIDYVVSVTYTYTSSSGNYVESATGTLTANVSVSPVAYLSGANTYYGTIEKALANTSGTIYVIPGRNPIIRNDCTIESGVTLCLPYDGVLWGNQSNEVVGAGHTYAKDNAYGKANLLITNVVLADGKTLTNNGTLQIGGILTGGSGGGNCGFTQGKHAQLTLGTNSKLISENGSIECYGFIAEQTPNNGSMVQIGNTSGTGTGSAKIPWVMFEHRGGTNTVNFAELTDKEIEGIISDALGGRPTQVEGHFKTIPFNRFFFPNISSTLKVYYGGSVVGAVNMFADGQVNQATVKVIGNTSEYMIQLSATNSSATAKHDVATTVTKLDVYGNMAVNPLTMVLYMKTTKSAMGVTININVEVTVETSKILLPLTWLYDISLHTAEGQSESTATFNQDVKIMPGGKLLVDSGVSVTANKLIVYDHSWTETGLASSVYETANGTKGRLILNGKLTVDEISGYIETTEDTGELKINSSNILTAYEAESLGAKRSIKYLQVVTIDNFSNLNYVTINSGITAYGYGVQRDGSTTSNTMQLLAGITYRSTGNAWYPVIESAIQYSNIDDNGTKEQEFTNGTQITLLNPTRDGYTFTSWIDDAGNTYAGGSDQTFYANITLTAQWSANSYTVTFIYENENGETVSSTESIEYDSQYGPYMPELTPKDGYELSWQIVETGKTIYANTYLTLATNHTIQAVWKSGATFTVKFETADGSTVADITVVEGESIEELPVSKRDNYNLKGWYTAASGGTKVEAPYTPTADVTLYAQWSTTVTYNANGGSDGTTSEQVDEGGSVTLPTPTRSGHRFTGWYTAASGGTKVGDAGASYTPNANITLYAQWIQQYTVTYNANSGSVSPSSVTVDADDPVTLPTPTRNNYTFNGWFTAASGGSKIGDAGATYKPTGNITLYAQWAEAGGDGCFAEGTLITLADGSKKQIELLSNSDVILGFDHETGKLKAVPIAYLDCSAKEILTVIDMVIGDTNVKVINEHGFFDVDLRKYVTINIDNVDEYLGHRFLKVYIDENGEEQQEIVTFTSYSVYQEETRWYALVTAFTINHLANDILTISDDLIGLYDYFELDDEYKYDTVQKEQDILTYGLFVYDDWKEYVTIEQFYAFNCHYLKVSVGKGLLTEDRIFYYINRYVNHDSAIQLHKKPPTPRMRQRQLCRLPL